VVVVPQADVTGPTVSVILPCLDEAESVAACVAEARAGLEQAGLRGEVIVVDNGSVDGSARLARDAGARVVREPVPGYGAALRRGLDEALGSIVVMADADSTYDLSRVGDLVAPLLDDSADLVLASRLQGATRRTMPALHRFVGTPMLSFLVRRAGSRIDVSDSQTGYRAMRTTTARALGLRGAGMEFASEMLILAGHHGLRITEIPIRYRARLGQSKLATLRDGIRHLQLILLLAPHLFLFWPGLALLGCGSILTAASVIDPSGFDLGPLRWQPVFFGPILIVLGTMAALSGAVIAHHSPLARISRTRDRFSFVSESRFARGVALTGSLQLAVGLGIDLVLFVVWITNETPPSRALALAGLAQALVITGAVLLAFALVYRLVIGQTGYTVDPARELEAARHGAG
jgi:hypothetical protein